MSDEKKIDEAMAFDSDAEFVAVDPDPTTSTATTRSPQDAGGMDQLRSLLLGPLANETDSKITQLGQRLEGAMLELDRRTNGQVNDLRTQYEKRLETMAAEIAELKQRQATTLQDVKGELEDCVHSLNRKMNELAKKLTKDGVTKFQAIRTELEQFSSSITGRLDCETEVLRSVLVDRDSLSAALSELAARVSGGSEMIVGDVGQPKIDLEMAIDSATEKLERPGR